MLQPVSTYAETHYAKQLRKFQISYDFRLTSENNS